MKFTSSSWIWTFCCSFWRCKGYLRPVFCMFLEFCLLLLTTFHCQVIFKAIQSTFSHLDTGHRFCALKSRRWTLSETSLKQFCKMITSMASWPLTRIYGLSNNSSNYVGPLTTLSIAYSENRNRNSIEMHGRSHIFQINKLPRLLFHHLSLYGFTLPNRIAPNSRSQKTSFSPLLCYYGYQILAENKWQ